MTNGKIRNVLQSRLKSGTKIPNWTADRGLLADEFPVSEVCDDRVTVDSPTAKNSQHIPMGQFELVDNLWRNYESEKTKRNEIREKTRFSKYIISILNWLEHEQ